MFPDPLLDYIRHELHRPPDLAAAIARELQRAYELHPKASLRQADSARPIDGAFELPRQPGERRADLTGATEEDHIDAAIRMLVNDYSDIASLAQGLRHLDDSPEPRHDQRAHEVGTQTGDVIDKGAEAGRSIQQGGVESERCSDDGGQLSIAQMGPENQQRPARLA